MGDETSLGTSCLFELEQAASPSPSSGPGTSFHRSLEAWGQGFGEQSPPSLVDAHSSSHTRYTLASRTLSAWKNESPHTSPASFRAARCTLGRCWVQKRSHTPVLNSSSRGKSKSESASAGCSARRRSPRRPRHGRPSPPRSPPRPHPSCSPHREAAPAAERTPAPRPRLGAVDPRRRRTARRCPGASGPRFCTH